MFLIEPLPAILMTLAVLYYLTDRPKEAQWLEPQESQWLQDRLDAERANREKHGAMSWFRSMLDVRVIALGFVYMGCNIPQYGLSFFLPQIVKGFGGLSNIEIGLHHGASLCRRRDRHAALEPPFRQKAERKWHT